MFKAQIFCQNYGGRREKKQAEPQTDMDHWDFLMIEMGEMAIDFYEERRHKMATMRKLAVEARAKRLRGAKEEEKEKAPVQPPAENWDY